MTGPRQRRMKQPASPSLVIRTADDIVAELAQVAHPDVARDPDESLAVLERLIREACVCVKAAGRREEPTYSHVSPEFSAAMSRVDEAPGPELRRSVKVVIDLLWGLGYGTSKKSPRRLDFEKEWDCAGIVSDISFEIRRRSFRPFPKIRWDI